MNDFEQAREILARHEFEKIPENRFPGMHGYPFEQLPDDWWSKVEAYKRADETLSLTYPDGKPMIGALAREQVEDFWSGEITVKRIYDRRWRKLASKE